MLSYEAIDKVVAWGDGFVVVAIISFLVVARSDKHVNGDSWSDIWSLKVSPPFFTNFLHCSYLAASQCSPSPLLPSVSSTDSTTVHHLCQNVQVETERGCVVGTGWGVRVGMIWRRRRLRRERRCAGWWTVKFALGGRAVAVRGGRAVADCVERGCGVEIRVAVEE